MKYKKLAGVLLSIFCLLGVLHLCPFSLAWEEEEELKGIEIMTQLSKRSVSDIDSQIATIQTQFEIEKNDVSSFSARFSGTIIMGDSLAAGLLEYRIMPESIVMAERGRRTNNIDGDVQNVINYAPKAVFMEYGINDLGYTRGNAELFASQYKEQVIKLQSALPNTKLYINSLTPISASAQAGNPVYTHVDEFNKALKKMCKELKVTYIDNTKTIDFTQDVYEYDGVHPYYPYYLLWLAKMANVAGL